MAGLAAARVLADHVDQITVLERRAEPAPGESIAAQSRTLLAPLEVPTRLSHAVGTRVLRATAPALAHV